jgi:hypothetical protein
MGADSEAPLETGTDRLDSMERADPDRSDSPSRGEGGQSVGSQNVTTAGSTRSG